MPAEQFLEAGQSVLDWIVRYHENVRDLPVVSPAKPGEVREKMADSPPVSGDAFDTILSDMDRVILPGITHWQSPRFFAYFPSNISGPSVLAELLSAGISVQGMLWKTSPAATELEAHVLDWLVYALGLPEEFLSTDSGGGVIQDTASSAVLCAVIAAREKATDGESNRSGARQPLTAYVSSQTHSSVEKAIRIAGLGSDNLRLVPVGDDLALDADALEQLVARDVETGFKPFFVCATVGTTSTNAMDPVRAVGEVCRGRDIWLHVDAAMSGTASLCPEFRYLQDGLEHADSYNFNPHKWMMTNLDCSCLYVRHRDDLISALSINPEYLHTAEYESGQVIDYRDWQIPLGRRFRALKLWFVLRYYGVEGLRHHVRLHVDMAQTVAAWMSEDADFDIVVPPVLNLFCFRLTAGERQTKQLLYNLNKSGIAYMTPTVINDVTLIRWCIGNVRTSMDDIRETWEHLVTLKDRIKESQS